MKNLERALELIAELKSLADNQFETHRIEVLERDLKSPPVVEVVDDTHQKFDGVVYCTDKKRHYRVNVPLHRAVWSYYNGEIPAGCDIHHIDWTTENNDISNLQLLTKSEHVSIHHRNITYAKTIDKFCANCGKKFQTRNTGRNNFCSIECQVRFNYRAKFETRKCVICQKEFKCSKYSQTKTCSCVCSQKLRNLDRVPTPKTEKRKCVICGKDFTCLKVKSTKTCSKSCSTKLSWNDRKAHHPKSEDKY